MALSTPQLHFILLPLMAQGHMIPMVDMARLLAQRGNLVTIITTALNANRFETVLSRAVESGLQIQVIHVYFPSAEVGLPQGCENFDTLPSMNSSEKFVTAINLLEQPVEQLFQELVDPPPSCLIADMSFQWATEVAHKFQIPRFVFHGPCCFSQLCMTNINSYNLLDNVSSESEHFLVPGLPVRIELTKAKLPSVVPNRNSPFAKAFWANIFKAEKEADGIVVNSFEELEPEFVKELAKTKAKRVWCIGPVSLCNKDQLDKAERGSKASIDQHSCLKWLNSWEENTVLFVCLGSLARLATSQMIELSLGLEATNRPFIWSFKHKPYEFDKWITEERFEERNKGRGLLVWGWAPQILILSHPAICGFLTHCGWNSILEAVSSGVPMITWPLFGEQFCNEKLIVEVLKIGISVGVETAIRFGEEEKIGILMKKDDIKRVVGRLMDGGEEGEEIRRKAKILGVLANKAVEDGGSSQQNITKLILYVMEQVSHEKSI